VGIAIGCWLLLLLLLLLLLWGAAWGAMLLLPGGLATHSDHSAPAPLGLHPTSATTAEHQHHHQDASKTACWQCAYKTILEHSNFHPPGMQQAASSHA